MKLQHGIWLLAPLMIVGCVTTTKVYEETANLEYPIKPSEENVLTHSDALIRPSLKDPDSLKNLSIKTVYKCYASKMELSDNLSPKYDYGYWCYSVTYNATNSYGGFVRGTEDIVFTGSSFQTVNQVGDTLRKFDDVYTYHSPR